MADQYIPTSEELVELLQRRESLSLRSLCRVLAPSTSWRQACAEVRTWPCGGEAPLAVWLAAQLRRLQAQGVVSVQAPSDGVNRSGRRFSARAGVVQPINYPVATPVLGHLRKVEPLYRLHLGFEVPARVAAELHPDKDVEFLAGHLQLRGTVESITARPGPSGLSLVLVRADVSRSVQRIISLQERLLELLPPVPLPLPSAGVSRLRPASSYTS